MESIIACGCHRILTSGQADSVTQGIKLIKELVEKADGRISIMAGGGLHAGNVLQFYPIGVREFHLSGTDKKEHGVLQTKVEKIEEVLESLQGLD
jgi:copper homeostasis protein